MAFFLILRFIQINNTFLSQRGKTYDNFTVQGGKMVLLAHRHANLESSWPSASCAAYSPPGIMFSKINSLVLRMKKKGKKVTYKSISSNSTY